MISDSLSHIIPAIQVHTYNCTVMRFNGYANVAMLCG